MTYTGRCPHCNAKVRTGHGYPIKRIGTPIMMCRNCNQPYLDDNMYEWSVISIPYKVYYIFLANNRFYGWLLLFMLSLGYPSYAVAGCFLWPLLCVAWFLLTKRRKIEESKLRTTNSQYIEILSRANYDKLAQRFDIY